MKLRLDTHIRVEYLLNGIPDSAQQEEQQAAAAQQAQAQAPQQQTPAANTGAQTAQSGGEPENLFEAAETQGLQSYSATLRSRLD